MAVPVLVYWQGIFCGSLNCERITCVGDLFLVSDFTVVYSSGTRRQEPTVLYKYACSCQEIWQWNILWEFMASKLVEWKTSERATDPGPNACWRVKCRSYPSITCYIIPAFIGSSFFYFSLPSPWAFSDFKTRLTVMGKLQWQSKWRGKSQRNFHCSLVFTSDFWFKGWSNRRPSNKSPPWR